MRREAALIAAAVLTVSLAAPGAARAMMIFENDLAGWQAAGGMAHVTLDFDEMTGPVHGDEYAGMPGGPAMTLMEGTGLAFGPTDQATASSGSNFLTPHAVDSEGIIRLVFAEPVLAVGAYFFDVEADFASTGFGTAPGMALPDVSFSSFQGQSMQSFLGFVSDVPLDEVEIHFATGADIDGTVVDDLRYVMVPEPGTALLVAAGLVGLGAAGAGTPRRRR